MKKSRRLVTSVLALLFSVLVNPLLHLNKSGDDIDGRFPREDSSKKDSIDYGGGDLPGPGPPQNEVTN